MSTQVGLRDYLGRGHHDDGREGIVLAKIAAGQLVKVPFGSGTGVGLAHLLGSSTASTQSNLLTNPDSSGTGVTVSVPAGLSQGGAWTEILYGSIVGVRWRRNNSSSLAPWGAVIDGVAYSIRNAKFRVDTVVASSTDQETLWIIADDLNPDIPHTVTLIWPSDAYGGVARSTLAYGWLLESSRGYKEPSRWGNTLTLITLSTSTTALVSTAVYRKFFVHNTDTVARKVTMKLSGTVIKEVFLAAAGSAGSSGEIDFGVPIVGSSIYTLEADANSVVKVLPIAPEVRI